MFIFVTCKHWVCSIYLFISGRIWLIKGTSAYIFGDFIIIFFNFLFPSDNGNYLSMIPIHSSASSTAMLTQNTLTQQACKCHGHPIDLVAPNKVKWRTQCRELSLCAGSVQCEETATRTRDLPVTGGKTLPLAPGPPFPNKAKWTCPITNRQLAASDVTATAVRIGEQTVFSADFF